MDSLSMGVSVNTQIMVLYAIDRLQGYGLTPICQADIACEANISRRHLIRALDALARAGVVTIDNPGRGAPNRYQINYDSAVEAFNWITVDILSMQRQ